MKAGLPFRIICVILCILVAVVSREVSAEETKRVALVIGNARYEAAVGALKNATNDARALSKTLRLLGFTVMEGHNLTRDELLKAVDAFRRSLSGAEVALFYYAGHGISVGDSNYLIPIRSGFDASGTDSVTLKMRAETRLFNAEQALADMSAGGARCNIMILDACRTSLIAKPSETRSFGVSGGLVEMTPTAGSLIAFSTDAGRTALDGSENNSIYTAELLKHLPTPGISIEQVFKRTRAGVVDRTKGEQVPAEYSRLVGEDIFLAGRAASVPVAKPVVESVGIFPRTIPPRAEDLAAAAKAGDSEAALNGLEWLVRLGENGDAVAEVFEALLDRAKLELEGLPDADKATRHAAAARVSGNCERILRLLPVALAETHSRMNFFASKAHNRHGDALFLLGRTEEAVAAFDSAERFAPEDAYVRINRGNAYLALGETEKARADFTAAADPALRQPKARAMAEEALRDLPAKVEVP